MSVAAHPARRVVPVGTPDTWARVDDYIVERLIGADPALEAALADAGAAGLPPIAVSPTQGRLLQLLVAMSGAADVLEIGTLGGYSTIWLARALPPGGRLVTLEIEPHHAEVAARNLERAGVAASVEIRVGPALGSLPALAAEGRHFDLVFIDADKENIASYFDHAVDLTGPGGVIVVDNVVRDGALADPSATDARVAGVRRFHEQLKDRTDVSATTIQTVGSKGYDGFTLAVVQDTDRG